jgi:hypothetical protein
MEIYSEKYSKFTPRVQSPLRSQIKIFQENWIKQQNITKIFQNNQPYHIISEKVKSQN